MFCFIPPFSVGVNSHRIEFTPLDKKILFFMDGHFKMKSAATVLSMVLRKLDCTCPGHTAHLS